MTDSASAVAMKKCPLCAEEIRHDAVKCKHCGSMLVKPRAPMTFEKRLSVGGWVWLVVGCIALLSTIALLGSNLIGPAILDGLFASACLWLAWNTGAIKFPCPGCAQQIKTTLKAQRVKCSRCGHEVALRPQV